MNIFHTYKSFVLGKSRIVNLQCMRSKLLLHKKLISNTDPILPADANPTVDTSN
jgi:hypothetical protein